MGKKIISILTIIAIMLGYVHISVLGRNDSISEFINLQRKAQISEDDRAEIAFAGKETVILKADLQYAKNAFMACGYSEEQATANAIKTLQEYEALYVQAVERGFQVTEQEIEEYLIELREFIRTAENTKDAERIIAAYGNEEEYWNYMKKVYKKRLPVQNYVKYMEQEYIHSCAANLSREEISRAWENEYNMIKNRAVEEQGFRSVNSQASY